LENIEKSNGQALQDMFVLSVLKGKKNGTYLEIGAQEPIFQNNTAILEKDFELERSFYRDFRKSM